MNRDVIWSVETVVATTLVLAIALRLTRDRGRHSGTSPVTRIVPVPWLMGLCVLFYSVMFIMMVAYPFFDRTVQLWVWWVFSVPFGMLGFLSAVSLTKGVAVEWTESTITGPAKEWNWTPRIPRHQLGWLEVRAFGTTPLSSWFLEARDGRRVYW